uniref:Probable RNA-binding protein EIF1AD n=1 Tax=Geotrypetes seraphini TaxID=260995 RepID=A0A6P8S0D0_GEOSA|nr:probable RNA-binding protein EIF1AD [Geotrypetes seraphini]
MSQATKRKHVVKEVLEDSVTLSEQQQIVQVLGCPGNNLHEVENDEGQRFLVSMPTKFRKNIWIKRGDFLIVDPIKEGEKVKAEISCILYKDHIRYLKKVGLWPARFVAADPTKNHTSDKNSCDQATTLPDPSETSEAEVSQTDSEDDSDLFVNTNRPSYTYLASEEESSEEDGASEEESSEEEKGGQQQRPK